MRYKLKARIANYNYSWRTVAKFYAPHAADLAMIAFAKEFPAFEFKIVEKTK